ncbi:unnamed protein product [Scytosiphon promiscuus]
MTPENVVEKMLAKQGGDRSAADPLEESGYTTDQAGTPTPDSGSAREDVKCVEGDGTAAERGDSYREEKRRNWESHSTAYYSRAAAGSETRPDRTRDTPTVNARREGNARTEGMVTKARSVNGHPAGEGPAADMDDDRHASGRRGTPPDQSIHGAPRFWRRSEGPGRNGSPVPRESRHALGPAPPGPAPAVVDGGNGGGGRYSPSHASPRDGREEASKARTPAESAARNEDPRGGREGGWSHHHQRQRQQQQQQQHPLYYRSHRPHQQQRHEEYHHHRGGGSRASMAQSEQQQQQQQQNARMLSVPPGVPPSSRGTWAPRTAAVVGGPGVEAAPPPGVTGRRVSPHPWMNGGSRAVHRLEDFGRLHDESAPRGSRTRMPAHADGPMVVADTTRDGGDAHVRGERGAAGGRPGAVPVAAASTEDEPYGWYNGGNKKGKFSGGASGGRTGSAPASASANADRAHEEEGNPGRGGEKWRRSPQSLPPPREQRQHAREEAERSCPAAATPSKEPPCSSGSPSSASSGRCGGGVSGGPSNRSPGRDSPKASLMARVAKEARAGGDEAGAARAKEGSRGSDGAGSDEDYPGDANDRRPPEDSPEDERSQQRRRDAGNGGGGGGPAPAARPSSSSPPRSPPPQQQQEENSRKRQRDEEHGSAGDGGGGGGGGGEADSLPSRKKTAVDELKTEGWTFRTGLGPRAATSGRGRVSSSAQKEVPPKSKVQHHRTSNVAPPSAGSAGGASPDAGARDPESPGSRPEGSLKRASAAASRSGSSARPTARAAVGDGYDSAERVPGETEAGGVRGDVARPSATKKESP